MKAGWRSAHIGDVCEVVNGGTPKTGVAAYWGGSHCWVTPAEMGKRPTPYIDTTERQITDAGLANSSARLIPPNSVILSSRAPIGHLVINTIAMATNQGCKGLVPNSELDHKFLYYFLAANVDLLNSLGTGATFKELSGSKLKEIVIPLPPLTEQKRIVEVLDKAFEGLAIAKANAEANLQNARELFESSIEDLFARLAANVHSTALENLCTNRGITYGVIKLGEHKPQGVPCLRTSNVRKLAYDLDGMKSIAPSLSNEYKRTILESGEVLVNVRGTLGGVCVVSKAMIGWNISREVAMVPVDAKKVDPQFVALYISTKMAQDWLTGVVKGAAYKGINIADLRKLIVPMPTFAEQKDITERASKLWNSVEIVKRSYREKFSGIDRLLQSLLQKAFAGELT